MRHSDDADGGDGDRRCQGEFVDLVADFAGDALEEGALGLEGDRGGSAAAFLLPFHGFGVGCRGVAAQRREVRGGCNRARRIWLEGNGVAAELR